MMLAGPPAARGRTTVRLWNPTPAYDIDLPVSGRGNFLLSTNHVPWSMSKSRVPSRAGGGAGTIGTVPGCALRRPPDTPSATATIKRCEARTISIEAVVSLQTICAHVAPIAIRLGRAV